MNRTPSRGQGRYSGKTPSKTPILKGLFADGIWKCNCDPRMPADHFQTKNGGPNHGRWFYTCQKPQPQRCGFFLWDNEAKAREARAVLSNSTTEPLAGTQPNTPEKTPAKATIQSTTPITPHTASRNGLQTSRNLTMRNSEPQKAVKPDDDWLHVSDDDFNAELRNLVDENTLQAPETPSKSAKRGLNASPSKRNREGYDDLQFSHLGYNGPSGDQDPFRTPNDIRGRTRVTVARTAPQIRGIFGAPGLPSPGVTPATDRFSVAFDPSDFSDKIPVTRDESPTARKSTHAAYPPLGQSFEVPFKPIEELPMTDLAKEILNALHESVPNMTDHMINSVKAISHKHTNELNKVQRSRDWCRNKLTEKDAKIARLEADMAKSRGQTSKK